MRATRIRLLEALLCTLACSRLTVAFHAVSPVPTHTANLSSQRQFIRRSATEEDCGCGGSVLYSGDPPDEVKVDFDIRESLRNKNIYDIKGNTVTMDEILGEPTRPLKGTSILSMLQWSQRKHELDREGVGLVFVSIGTPEKGKIVAEHLGLPDAETLLFVDPDNVLYDAIRLRRGVDRTFFNIETPLAFVDRFTKRNGLKELGQVLSKWNKAFIIPPKQDQAFMQGGTFVFKGPETLFAHYDPSTASHANMNEVIETAVKALKESATSSR